MISTSLGAGLPSGGAWEMRGRKICAAGVELNVAEGVAVGVPLSGFGEGFTQLASKVTAQRIVIMPIAIDFSERSGCM